ncbi:senescence-specific cysteine protease SAG12-like [Lycium barbarum]|uniref:senescence-specific cysteine protease SAG12-like n=1 Tax=Lycium barbarum TaxID=112863 RepID=UPI00293F0408|nr:senescence-specific cysteine protease SAG12-like [Lycium barbarum]
MAFNFCFKISLVLFFIINLYVSTVTSRDLKKLSMLERHEKWMARHGRVYKDEIEKEQRFKTFKENVEFIESFNQNGTQRYKLAINKYTDLTNEEFMALFTGLDTSLSQQKSTATTSSFKYESLTEVPLSMDWRNGSVTGIKDQGQCECCWAFSAVAAIEGAYQIANNKLISLSEQQLLDCSTENKGCKGGLMTLAYDFLLQNGGGITTETNYPYQQSQSICSTQKISSTAAVTISGYELVPPSESSLLKAVANQPISVCIAASHEFLMYGSGIYDGSCDPELNHAVTLIGYGAGVNGTKYWLVKNSWGTSWGEEGYMRIARDVGVDGGHCGIASAASFPTV